MNNVYLQQQTAPQQIPSQFNAQYARALASGDPRHQMKKQQLDRPGISRGRAQMNMAGIGAADDMAQGLGDAYSQAIQTNAANNAYQLQDAEANEQFSQNLGAIQQQNAYAQQMAALQRQSSILSGLLR